jgi:hypothetical protein
MALTLNSSVWGNHYWKVLYCIALTYPDNPTDEIKNRTKLFLQNLCLPCDKCQEEYNTISLVIYPVIDETVSTRNNLLKWIKNIKNIERKKNNQPLYTENDIYYFFKVFDNITIRDAEYFCCEN